MTASIVKLPDLTGLPYGDMRMTDTEADALKLAQFYGVLIAWYVESNKTYYVPVVAL